MDFSVLIGRSVVHKGFRGYGEGIVFDVNYEYVSVDFNGEIKKFALEIFDQHFDFQDEETGELMLNVIKEVTDAKAAAEAAKIVAEEVAKKAEAEAAERARIDGMFGADYHVEHLERDPVFAYQQVETKFGIRITGFGRGCNPTDDSVVLISSVNQAGDHFVYHDKWAPNGDFIFSGEGRNGDQRLTSRNKEIINAEKNGKEIHLFVKFSSEEYYYQGIFKLVDYTYEDDLDEDGNIRKEYKFRLRKV